MPKVDDFFSINNTVNRLSNDDLEQVFDYLEPIRAFARTTNKSLYVINYQTRGFEYVSENPLFLCGYSADEVKEMGYEFYLKNVPAKDLQLLLKINTVGFDFYERIPIAERKQYTISYDFQLLHQNGRTILINQKLTPLFLTQAGKIWKGLCIVSLSAASNSGNIKINKAGSNIVFSYDLAGNCWIKDEQIALTEREIEILRLSVRGLTISEIAEKIFLSVDTIKFHRRNIFKKLEVSNISEAISSAVNNKLI